jgi:hypothetical protein
MQAFLEACALEIVVADAAEAVSSMSNTQAAAQLVALVWGRVDAGILRLDDVREVTDLIDDYLGLDVVSRLREIATKAQEHTTIGTLTLCTHLAREWAELVREVADEKGDAQPDSCDRFSGMGGEARKAKALK